MGKMSVLHMPIILHLVVFSYYKMDRKMILKSDLTELRQSYEEGSTYLRVKLWAGENVLWQEFS